MPADDRTSVALRMLDGILASAIPRVMEDCDGSELAPTLARMAVMDAMREVDAATGSSMLARYVPLMLVDRYSLGVLWHEDDPLWDPAEDGMLRLVEMAPFPEDDCGEEDDPDGESFLSFPRRLKTVRGGRRL